ncbi:MAG: hypothetical protein JWN22_2834 [Nocardioides sp.]|nr:hypothetical protein [Nocardioides sp.]
MAPLPVVLSLPRSATTLPGELALSTSLTRTGRFLSAILWRSAWSSLSTLGEAVRTLPRGLLCARPRAVLTAAEGVSPVARRVNQFDWNCQGMRCWTIEGTAWPNRINSGMAMSHPVVLGPRPAKREQVFV